MRIDSGVREGDEITSHYDPMIAKLICWDEQRPLAVRRINRALEEYRIVGVTHNLNFLANVLDSRPFIAGDLSTRFLADHAALLVGTRACRPALPGPGRALPGREPARAPARPRRPDERPVVALDRRCRAGA